MRFDHKKWVQLTIALCIIFLQILQPFIHVHLDIENHAHTVGFHVGGEYEHDSSATNLHSPTNQQHMVADTSNTPDLVSVASGIKKELEQGFSASLVLAVLACLCLFLLLQSEFKYRSVFTYSFHESIKRRLPASRAPPQR